MSETKMTPFEWQQTLPAVYGQEFDIFECVCEGSSMWVKAVVFTTSLTCPSERYLMMESLGSVTGCDHWNQELEYGKFEGTAEEIAERFVIQPGSDREETWNTFYNVWETIHYSRPKWASDVRDIEPLDLYPVEFEEYHAADCN